MHTINDDHLLWLFPALADSSSPVDGSSGYRQIPGSGSRDNPIDCTGDDSSGRPQVKPGGSTERLRCHWCYRLLDFHTRLQYPQPPQNLDTATDGIATDNPASASMMTVASMVPCSGGIHSSSTVPVSSTAQIPWLPWLQ